ncbi:MAG: type II secretion system protein GspG [Akkermansiaceae bacterium]|nr:type II secretion system protein GspG [Akkermansiaceae bacterium]
MNLPTRSSSSRRRSSRRGFTLLEMVIVLSIIAMIMGGMIYGFRTFADRAKPQQVKADFNFLLNVLDMYRINNKRYPTNSEGLDAVMPKSGSNKDKGTDPWGNAYVYRFPGSVDSSKPEIICKGPDGQEGTGDDLSSQKDL